MRMMLNILGWAPGGAIVLALLISIGEALSVQNYSGVGYLIFAGGLLWKVSDMNTKIAMKLTNFTEQLEHVVTDKELKYELLLHEQKLDAKYVPRDMCHETHSSLNEIIGTIVSDQGGKAKSAKAGE